MASIVIIQNIEEDENYLLLAQPEDALASISQALEEGCFGHKALEKLWQSSKDNLDIGLAEELAADASQAQAEEVLSLWANSLENVEVLGLWTEDERLQALDIEL